MGASTREVWGEWGCPQVGVERGTGSVCVPDSFGVRRPPPPNTTPPSPPPPTNPGARLVLVLLFGQEPTGLLQAVDDGGRAVGQHGQALQPGPRVGSELARVVHGGQQGQAAAQAHRVIFLAVAGGGVHQAGARLGRDVVAADDDGAGGGGGGQGGGVGGALQVCAFQRVQHSQATHPLLHLAHQAGRHDEAAATARRGNHVVQPVVDGDGRVGGQGPCRRRPHRQGGLA